MAHRTEQEEFWAGAFGTEYSRRNAGSSLLAANLGLFARALRMACPPRDCIEFGANIGMNLQALKMLYPDQQQFAIEINADAIAKLKAVIPEANIFSGSILEFQIPRQFELVLIKGVLIHLNPDCITQAYDALYRAAGRYLLLCEYYNPTPVEVPYRNHLNRLFKRDFCGDLLDRYGDLHLVDYGFTYHRACSFPQDDLTWFLLEKRV